MPKTSSGYHVDRLCRCLCWPTAAGALLGLISACGHSSVPSPFTLSPDAASDAPASKASDGGGGPQDARIAGDPLVGGPCDEDADCDDGLECTFDECVSGLSRCRFSPDPSTCQDDVFCNGAEVCVPGVGCRSAESPRCSDGLSCTIERCDEDRRACEVVPRDADGDGDPDENCPGGADCAEDDPLVSGTMEEVCGNGVDDDCDGETDEAACVAPQFDLCASALELSGDGRFELDPGAASLDYAASCVEAAPSLRDLVIAVEVPEGEPVDVDLTAVSPSGDLTLAHVGTCGDASSEQACLGSARSNALDSVARLRLRALPPGPHAVLLFTDSSATVVLEARYEHPEPEATNETCGTAEPLLPGVHVGGRIVDAEHDLETLCDSVLGDRVYAFRLEEPSDVRLFAASTDAVGRVSVSLLGEQCAAGEPAEITCRTGVAAELFARALDPGPYYVGVSATAATDYDLVLQTEPPSVPPADEKCEAADELTANAARSVDLADHTDDVQDGCLAGAPDAVYWLDLTARSDVLLVQRLAGGDVGSVSLRDAKCSDPPLACGEGATSPVRAVHHRVPAGRYSVVVESQLGNPATLTALTRPAQPPTLVAFADDCDAAVLVPPAGGFFQGNTANARADYEAGCDVGGRGEDGAADQMLRLVLTERRRVVLDARGSDFSTLVNLRRGPDCPGEEVPRGCSAGFGRDRSFVDVVLDAGEYFIQMDGYAGAQGPWWLDVFVVEP